MKTFIDWLSISIRRPTLVNSDLLSIQHAALDAFTPLLEICNLPPLMALLGEATPQRGRPPFEASYHFEGGATLFYGRNTDYVLLEISGQGCDTLRAFHDGSDIDLAYVAAERVTRLDIATDVQNDLRPLKMAENIPTGRMKARSTVVSDTGETLYIGSRKSDRYLRIYRYDQPHPRSHLLRYEWVIKRPHVLPTLEAIVKGGIQTVANTLAMEFKCDSDYGHGETIDIERYRPERRQGKTERWLIAQCAPAFQKLVREGVIDDPAAWLTEHFLSNLPAPKNADNEPF